MVDPDDTSHQPASPDRGDTRGGTTGPSEDDAADATRTTGDSGSETGASAVDAETPGPEPEPDDGPGGRDVVVPLRMYKTVTVFSTLIAIVAILTGFVLLDRGTQRATASPEEVSLPVVALGLAFIVGGSAVYAFSTRFRTEGMGKSKDDTAESSDNG